MEYEFLGKTGVKVSRLAFGTMSFGGDADEDESARLFARCRDAGVNLFDCADVYSKGRSEQIPFIELAREVGAPSSNLGAIAGAAARDRSKRRGVGSQLRTALTRQRR